jgi:hypothetical protein
MQRIGSALALVALAASASAQSVPSGSGIPDNAHSAMVHEVHPASMAHANAIAGQTDAARIEACAQMAHDFLDDLGHGDFKAAASNFDAKMQAAVTATRLGESWQSVGARFGRLESRGDSQAVMVRGTPLVSTPLHFAKGSVVSQLACDGDGRISGFGIRPVRPPTPAAASSSEQ